MTTDIYISVYIYICYNHALTNCDNNQLLNSSKTTLSSLSTNHCSGEIIYRVELPDMEQITLIYLENNDADYRKSSIWTTNNHKKYKLKQPQESTANKKKKKKQQVSSLFVILVKNTTKLMFSST